MRFRVTTWMAGLLAFGAMAFVPSSALAWTDASVASVRANVEVDEHGTALVTLALRVRVHGGWLTDIDVDGLDSDLSLEGAGLPWAVDEAGVQYAPTVRTFPGGRVRLQFDRHNAPRRGTSEIGFRYRTVLAHRATVASADGEHIRIRWTLPAWQTGLDGVVLTATVPGRSRAVYDDDEERDVAVVNESFDQGRTTITYRRVHLPRTTPWTIAFEAQASAMDASLGSARSTATRHVTKSAPTWPIRFGVAAFLLMLLVGKERLLRAQHVGVRSFVTMPAALRATLVLTSLAWLAVSPRGNTLSAVLALAALVIFGLVRTDGPRLAQAQIRKHLSLNSALTLGTATGTLVFAVLAAVSVYVARMPYADTTGNRLLLYVVPLLAWPIFVAGIERREPELSATAS